MDITKSVQSGMVASTAVVFIYFYSKKGTGFPSFVFDSLTQTYQLSQWYKRDDVMVSEWGKIF